jgi:hypothetical protein
LGSLYTDPEAISTCVKEVVLRLAKEVRHRARVKILKAQYFHQERVWKIQGVVMLKSLLGVDYVNRKSFTCVVSDEDLSVQTLSLS